ncbi:MAG: zinc-ribbon domain-containing protein [Candidatus Hodarchaeales archaeon]
MKKNVIRYDEIDGSTQIDNSRLVKCSNCGNTVGQQDKFCMKYGSSIPRT